MPNLDAEKQALEVAELEEAKALVKARRLRGAGGTQAT